MQNEKPNALLDAIKEAFKLRRDSALAKHLGLNPATVSRIRSGSLQISDEIRVKVMRKCRWSLKKIDELSPLP